MKDDPLGRSGHLLADALRGIVFDFDGVIVRNSEAYKQQAFEAIFLSWGESGAAALARAREEFKDGKGSRFEIIASALRALGVSSDRVSEEVARLAGDFDAYTQERIAREGVHPDDRAALAALAGGFPLYVSSVTPTEPLTRSLDALGIARLFQGIYGAPGRKEAHLRDIAGRLHCGTEDLLFVGDGEGDRRAALAAGSVFVGIRNDRNGWASDASIPSLSSVAELPAFLRASARAEGGI